MKQGISRHRAAVDLGIFNVLAGDLQQGSLGALLSVRDRRVETLMRYPTRITSISGGQPFAAPLVSNSLEEGAVFVRYGFVEFDHATDMQSPQTLLNRGNFIIASHENRIELYKWHHRESANRIGLCAVKG